MRGTHRVIIQNKKIKYDFQVRRNITIIRGDSATGKTALIDMIRENYENGSDSGIELYCDKNCAVMEGRNWVVQLSVLQDSIVFIDEGNTFIKTKDFATAIQKTDNYYVIVTREGLPSLPYSVDEIYGIRSSGKYGNLKQTYNELYHMFGRGSDKNKISPQVIITEDSNSGFQFFESICKSNGIICISAGGKSNIFKCLMQYKSDNVLVIADGAAFGSEMEKVVRMLQIKDNTAMYLPESFEWIILKSGVVKDNELKQILSDPGEYIESQKYFSWERFFAELLTQKTENTYLAYSKRTLNSAYIQNNTADKILSVMEKIDL